MLNKRKKPTLIKRRLKFGRDALNSLAKSYFPENQSHSFLQRIAPLCAHTAQNLSH